MDIVTAVLFVVAVAGVSAAGAFWDKYNKKSKILESILFSFKLTRITGSLGDTKLEVMLLSTDGGFEWFVVEPAPYGWTIIGPAEKRYPGLVDAVKDYEMEVLRRKQYGSTNTKVDKANLGPNVPWVESVDSALD